MSSENDLNLLHDQLTSQGWNRENGNRVSYRCPKTILGEHGEQIPGDLVIWVERDPDGNQQLNVAHIDKDRLFVRIFDRETNKVLTKPTHKALRRGLCIAGGLIALSPIIPLTINPFYNEKFHLPKRYSVNIYPLSQNNPNWATDPLGYVENFEETIGTKGCAITILSMLQLARGITQTPNDINSLFKENHIFQSKYGFDIIKGPAEIGLTLYYMSDFYLTDPYPLPNNEVRIIKQLIYSHRPPLLYVDANPNTKPDLLGTVEDGKLIGLDQHYILAYGFDENSILCIDPFDGNRIRMEIDGKKERYGGLRKGVKQIIAYKERVS